MLDEAVSLPCGKFRLPCQQHIVTIDPFTKIEGGFMKKLFAATVLALGVLGFTSTANAIPIKWTLTDIAFDDDGIATGST